MPAWAWRSVRLAELFIESGWGEQISLAVMRKPRNKGI
jgi:hypothetical protein